MDLGDEKRTRFDSYLKFCSFKHPFLVYLCRGSRTCYQMLQGTAQRCTAGKITPHLARATHPGTDLAAADIDLFWTLIFMEALREYIPDLDSSQTYLSQQFRSFTQLQYCLLDRVAQGTNR